MAKKLKEQIDYGNRRERMDPNLERKLGDPESLYAKNPAMKKGTQDVQRFKLEEASQKVPRKINIIRIERKQRNRQRRFDKQTGLRKLTTFRKKKVYKMIDKTCKQK